MRRQSSNELPAHYQQPLELYLGDNVEVGHQGALQNDGNVGGVEQLDRV